MTEANTVRLLLDQGLPRDDEEILSFAAEQKVKIVTLDADFHTMLAVSGTNQPSAIRIRIQALRAPEISRLIDRVSIEFSDQLASGALITVKTRKTTCHRLPIGKYG